MNRLTPWTTLTLSLAIGFLSSAHAASPEVAKPIDQRFSQAKTAETPDFQRHVAPLMGRLGCNGRACHGSFQGQGGFQLSLFGYDFKMDHDNLTEGDDPRVDLTNPELSLMLLKPTMEYPHKGGLRMKEGSWEYNILHEWVKGGAKNVETPMPLTKLEVLPHEIVFQKDGQKQQLQVIAHWEDGSKEDVTPLCRFNMNDDQVGTVTENGLVTSGIPGDSHVVISYDTGVVPIPVMRPVSEFNGPNYPKVETPTVVDAKVVEKLQKIGIVPSDECTDAEFLRRLSLDLTGTLPTAQQVADFLADPSPDKRSRKIDELLETPAYAAWWTTKLCDITGNNESQLNNISPIRARPSQDWYDWIYKRVAENKPYDEIASGIILASGREKNESFEEYCKNMTDLYRPDSKKEFADRESMQYYWARRNMRRPEEKALAFAYSFMGIRIQCAQCHKHPFDQWTQDDYKQFTQFFQTINFGTNRDTREAYAKLQKELGLEGKRGNELRRELPKLIQQGKTVPFTELYVTRVRESNNNRRRQRADQYVAPSHMAKLLGGDVVNLTKYEDPREPLMKWLRDPQNGYFAKAFVNRTWANYFNVGIVEPADDMSLANPPSNAPLLDYLTEGFIKSGYDMKWLHREILNSRTYQLSWKPNATNRHDEKNFSRAVPRRLPAEVAYDALVIATSSDEAATELMQNLKGRAIALASSGSRGRGSNAYAMTIFGRNLRESNCDCDRSSEPSLLQTVYLRNDLELHNMIDKRDGWVAQVAKELGLNFRASTNNAPRKPKNYDQLIKNYRKRIATLEKAGKTDQAKRMQKQLNKFRKRFNDSSPAKEAESVASTDGMGTADAKKLVDQVWLRTLSRYPTAEEQARGIEHLTNAEDKLEGIRGLLWALVNTKEFIVNH